MSLVFSSYNVGSHSDIAPTCLGECTKSSAKLSNLAWISDTSINPAPEPEPEPEPGRLIITDNPSEFLSACEIGCTECRKAYFENFPDDFFGECVNSKVYRYTNKCN